jgi:hypothetical protein
LYCINCFATAMVPVVAVAALLYPLFVSATYSEEEAISNVYLSVSAYCGSPKYNATFLQNWECGPSCTGAGSVTGIDLFQDADLGIFGLTGHYNGHCLLAFRGTSSGDGWKTDLDSSLVDLSWTSCPGGCKIESGFNKGYLAVRSTIASTLSSYGCKDLTITGHSLGAALSTIAAYDFGSTYTINDVYNFGSPRVGNPAFASSYNSKYSNHWRVTHYKDPIPHGPTLGMGFYHLAQEAYYHNTTAAGYKICTESEDKSCADQFGGNLFADLALAACCADDHLEYMQDAVSVATDGGSCTHVAMSTAMQHAYLTTASYCSAEDLVRWDCGAPCSNVDGGVHGVHTFDVPFKTALLGASLPSMGAVRGFVGHIKSEVGSRCVLSLQNLFSAEDGLAVIKAATAHDLVHYDHKDCHECRVYGVLMNALSAAKLPLADALEKAGCTKDAPTVSGRRLVIVGHGLGSSLGQLLAFHLKTGTGYKHGSFGIEAGFQFGAPRPGNGAFAAAFRQKLGGDIFRVTHSKDPYVQYPSFEAGFVQLDQELFFNGSASWGPDSYKRCPVDGEDPACAQKFRGHPGPLSDHTKYLQPLVKVDMSASACRQAVVV